MTDRQHYMPGPASGAEVRTEGAKWTLILVRQLRHAPETVWQALIDPAQLRQNFISMGAAGWHICLDVLDHLVGGEPLGRIVAGDAMKFEWPRLNAEYAQQFGVAKPNWPPKAKE